MANLGTASAASGKRCWLGRRRPDVRLTARDRRSTDGDSLRALRQRDRTEAAREAWEVSHLEAYAYLPALCPRMARTVGAVGASRPPRLSSG